MTSRFRCATCGEEHDLNDLEPSYNRPDAYFDVPAAEREHLTSFGSSSGRIRDAEDVERRHFLRVLMPIPVRGEEQPCSWGVWVEVSGWAWNRTKELWDAPDQHEEPAFPGVLANTLKGYEGTIGLSGMVQLTGPETVPDFILDPDVDHAIAREQREGVYLERVYEWLGGHHPA